MTTQNEDIAKARSIPPSNPPQDSGQEEKTSEVEKVWNDFWKEIVAPSGDVDLELVKCELYDFWQAMDNVSRVYCHITGSRISKILTNPDAVCSVADEYYSRLARENQEGEQSPENADRPVVEQGGTPETDASWFKIIGGDGDQLCHANFARRLEKERNAARAEAYSWEACVRVRENPENKSPCGHHMNFAYSPDGAGKAIRCYLCELAAANEALSLHKSATGFCEKHQPTGGARNCLVCGCERLSFALHQICAAIENEPDVNTYALYCNEENVVKQVRETVAALALAKEERDYWKASSADFERFYCEQLKGHHNANAKIYDLTMALREVLKSAHPHPVENKSMHLAWENATAALNSTTSTDLESENARLSVLVEEATELLKRSAKWLDRLVERREYIRSGFFEQDTDPKPLAKDVRAFLIK